MTEQYIPDLPALTDRINQIIHEHRDTKGGVDTIEVVKTYADSLIVSLCVLKAAVKDEMFEDFIAQLIEIGVHHLKMHIVDSTRLN